MLTTYLCFRNSVRIMVEMFKDMKWKGFTEMKYLNIGGGLGIPYTRHVRINVTSVCNTDSIVGGVTECLRCTRIFYKNECFLNSKSTSAKHRVSFVVYSVQVSVLGHFLHISLAVHFLTSTNPHLYL